MWANWPRYFGCLFCKENAMQELLVAHIARQLQKQKTEGSKSTGVWFFDIRTVATQNITKLGAISTTTQSAMIAEVAAILKISKSKHSSFTDQSVTCPFFPMVAVLWRLCSPVWGGPFNRFNQASCWGFSPQGYLSNQNYTAISNGLETSVVFEVQRQTYEISLQHSSCHGLPMAMGSYTLAAT